MDGYVRKLQNPTTRLATLRSMPIHMGNPNAGILADKVAGDGHAYKHVPKADRVRYFDLRMDPGPPAQLTLHLETVATSVTLTSWGRAKKLRPLYYLPYEQNGTTRMKLAPPVGYAGDDIDFFTTATIDGCSVYIEGPAATPKVSHLNAQNVQPTRRTDTWVDKQLKIQAKVDDMDARFAHIRKGAANVVERPHYIADDPALLAPIKQQFAARMGIRPADVGDYNPFGAVLGFRDTTTGDWAFYLQENTAMEYKTGRLTPGGRPEYKTAKWVLNVREIWPNGGGFFRTIP